MSYEVTYVPTEEKMKSYQYQGCDPKRYNSLHREVVLELISNCLKPQDPQINILTKISNFIEQLVFLSKMYEYYYAYSEWEKEKEITYFRDEFEAETEGELEAEKTRVIKSLYIIATVVDTPNYFEARDKFEELVREIEDIIENFEDVAQGYYTHEIQEDLKEFKKEYDLDDIYKSSNMTCLVSHDPQDYEEVKDIIASGEDDDHESELEFENSIE